MSEQDVRALFDEIDCDLKAIEVKITRIRFVELEKQQWIDWLSPLPLDLAMASAEPMLTKPELLAQLAHEGVNATARNLVYWQSRGVIPFPSKQQRGRSKIALYPSWMVEIVALLRAYQANGLNQDEIRCLLIDRSRELYDLPQIPHEWPSGYEMRRALLERTRNLRATMDNRKPKGR